MDDKIEVTLVSEEATASFDSLRIEKYIMLLHIVSMYCQALEVIDRHLAQFVNVITRKKKTPILIGVDLFKCRNSGMWFSDRTVENVILALDLKVMNKLDKGIIF